MFLYSLMAEGGLPQALLVAQQGLYRRVVLGLLAEMEAEGGLEAAPFSERIAARWITMLPQTFQTTDFVRLLAELALLALSAPASKVEPAAAITAVLQVGRFRGETGGFGDTKAAAIRPHTFIYHHRHGVGALGHARERRAGGNTGRGAARP